MEPLRAELLGVQQSDEKDAARRYWEKLLALLPANSQDAANLQAMIDGL